MTIKKYGPLTFGVADAARAREVQQEIDSFLLALRSYPDRFADDPCLSFEQYLFSIMSQPTRQAGEEQVA